MALTRKHTSVVSLFLAAALLSIVALIFRAFTEDWTARNETYRKRAEAAYPPTRSAVAADRLVLVRDRSVTIGRTRLVFFGLHHGRIRLGLTLLDLDPQYVYPREIPRAARRQTLHLGPRHYRIKKVNSDSLTLFHAE